MATGLSCLSVARAETRCSAREAPSCALLVTFATARPTTAGTSTSCIAKLPSAPPPPAVVPKRALAAQRAPYLHGCEAVWELRTSAAGSCEEGWWGADCAPLVSHSRVSTKGAGGYSNARIQAAVCCGSAVEVATVCCSKHVTGAITLLLILLCKYVKLRPMMR
eukprot:6199520-Pleurochrysis_carterae.AAC.1